MHLRTEYKNYLLASVSLGWIFACGGSDSGGSLDPKNDPYGERKPTTKTSSTLHFDPGSILSSPDIKQNTTVVGQKTVGDKSYDRLATLNVDDPSQGGEYWIKQNQNGTVDFAGFDVHSTLAATLIPPGSVVFDTPLTVKIDAPLGVSQPVTMSGSYTPTGTTTPTTVTATGQYTLVEKDTVATTDMGPVAGCNHYTGSLSSSSDLIPEPLRGITLNGDLWYHPSFGVVAFKVPDLGFETRMKDTSDCGEKDSSGHRTIRKVAIVDATQGKFELSAYGCAGNFDADKNTHAKMLLELRWSDESQAKTSTMPTHPYQFQTVFGMFPSTLVQSPVSVLHPEENGKGFVYWIAYVDQAAKNSPGSNGISYGVTVSPGSGLAAVRASARIYYKVYP